MTITYKTGNIFDSESQTLVNPVNCVGVMGKGLAAEFKRRYPKMYTQYKAECDKGYIEIGDTYLYTDVGDKHILLFPTKKQWREPSQITFIKNGLESFLIWFEPIDDESPPITSIAFPALGCGEGGLDWSDVKPLMDSYLGDLDIPIEIYEPVGSTT